MRNETTQTTVTRVAVPTREKPAVGDSLLRRALRNLRRDPLTLLAMAFILVLTLAVVFAPAITRALGVDPISTNPSIRLLPPGTPGHILGTDDLGRDHLARLLYAGQVSLSIGFIGSALTLVIGMFFGVVTGYFGGIVDDLMNWIIVTLDSIPSLYLLIIVSALFRPSAEALIFVLALTGWTGTTRLIRGETFAIRGQEYVMGARAVGASPWQIMASHILPNLVSVTAISLAGGIGSLILAESALSFLNIGVQPPTPTWGNMLSNAQQFFVRGPHLVLLPGLLIFITVLCLYIIGDGLRDAFDPKTITSGRKG
jgi:peptide/nickel transport system permease protein